MYLVTKSTRESDKTVIVGAASIKGAAWEKMRKAVIAELLARDALDPFVDIHKRLPQDGGEFCYCGVGTRIDPIHGNSALVYGDGTTVRFSITEYPDEGLFGPILRALAENYEKYGLTGKQKSQVMGLLSKFEEDI